MMMVMMQIIHLVKPPQGVVHLTVQAVFLEKITHVFAVALVSPL